MFSAYDLKNIDFHDDKFDFLFLSGALLSVCFWLQQLKKRKAEIPCLYAPKPNSSANFNPLIRSIKHQNANTSRRPAL